MVKHIVVWRLADVENKTKIANEMKAALEAMKGKIDEIIDLEVGINYNDSEFASDIVLISTFESKEALDAYIVHPEHKAVGANYVRPNVSERRVIDFEF